MFQEYRETNVREDEKFEGKWAPFYNFLAPLSSTPPSFEPEANRFAYALFLTNIDTQKHVGNSSPSCRY
jgi:hypothetical protein